MWSARVNRRAFLAVAALMACGVGAALGQEAGPERLYLPAVRVEILAAWGWVEWDAFAWA